ncbi:hypothetical protein RhiirA4_455707 [Rhizophagus irregularis]|uniref:Uncharacterized protein n=1 Tax=Rhizophagus irregularis TaxID=588596 RepID=A0A2I1G5R4_9GLOM|nr:hypothetical protein RhiirA4_455707 [Rhizophagus irregularis]
MEWEDLSLFGGNRKRNRRRKNSRMGNETTMIGYRIISLAEQSDILRQYTTLNDDFTKRLKDENRATDDENVTRKDLRTVLQRRNSRNVGEWRIRNNIGYLSHVISRKKFFTDNKLKTRSQKIWLLLGGFWVLRSQHFREAISYLALFTVFLTEGLNTKSRKFNE